jgi:hypothetical protein
MNRPQVDWSVAIIASRENLDALMRCITAVLKACCSHEVIVDVLVNGNPALASQAAPHVQDLDKGNDNVRIWSIPAGDKANAWNEYVHRIWPAGRHAFFVDGYVEVRSDAFRALAEQMESCAGALAATGVPSAGRSAPALREQMLRQGGMHGNMHLIHATAMTQLRDIGFRLPLGLYRTDSLVGAVLMYGLDTVRNRWETSRIAVARDATWDIPSTSAFTMKDVVAQLKRRIRQAQGDLENKALREHMSVLRQPINQLPATSQALVANWLTSKPKEARSMFLKRPLCLYAAHKLRKPRNWPTDTTASSLVTAGSRETQARSN